jgi:DNA topoisomerase-2
MSLLISISRPDSYIGSIEKLTEYQWVYDEDKGLNYRSITYVPGLYKVC